MSVHELVLLYQAIPTPVVTTIIGGTGVSLFAQVVKKLFGLNSDKVIKLMVASTAVVVAALQYLLSTHALPLSVLGSHSAQFYAGAELFYAFVYKSVTPFLSQVQSYKARKAAVVASDSAVASVDAPVASNTVDF